MGKLLKTLPLVASPSAPMGRGIIVRGSPRDFPKISQNFATNNTRARSIESLSLDHSDDLPLSSSRSVNRPMNTFFYGRCVFIKRTFGLHRSPVFRSHRSHLVWRTSFRYIAAERKSRLTDCHRRLCSRPAIWHIFLNTFPTKLARQLAPAPRFRNTTACSFVTFDFCV